MSTTFFPSNVKIITWNYDFQIQLAGEYFQQERYDLFKGASRRSFPLIRYWPEIAWSGVPTIRTHELSLIHLNGLAGSFYNRKTETFDNVFLHKDEMGMDSNLHYLRQYLDSSVFNFAWEEGNYQDWLVSTSNEMIQDTTIVIVIGYSFPFFNRIIDKKIFEKLKETGTLRKIYFQDPYLDGTFLKAQFELNDSVEIIHRKEVESFYIPFEL